MSSAENVALHALVGLDRGRVVLADNLDVLREVPDSSLDLIYVDPPFNSGKVQSVTRMRTTRDPVGDRVGFKGHRYKTTVLSRLGYSDDYDDYLGFLEPRIAEFRRVLKLSGSLYFHVDYREVHYCKILIDAIFGRECFLNEIIWAYDYGARSKRKWPTKHDNILVYVKSPGAFFFDAEAVDRIPYMAPGLVGPEKAAKGKLPTDTWWHTIVPPGGRERTRYPTQKPVGILKRIIAASSPPDGLVGDFFAGSGSFGAAAAELRRRFVLVDSNPEAVQVMAERLAGLDGIDWVNWQGKSSASQLRLQPRIV